MHSAQDEGNTNAALNSTARPTFWQRLVGLLVLWQLLYLIGGNTITTLREFSNSLPFSGQQTADVVVPGWAHNKGHLYQLQQGIGKCIDHWGELTGQSQRWLMFAPGVLHGTTFPAVAFRFDQDPASTRQVASHLRFLGARDPLTAVSLLALKKGTTAREPILVLSEDEPKDILNYQRLGELRIHRITMYVTVDLVHPEDVPPALVKNIWRQQIANFVRNHQALIIGYLFLRLNQALQEGTVGQQPHQLVLLARQYRVCPPGEGPVIWKGPFTVPVACWRPTVMPGMAPLEAYNPVTEQFERVAP